MRLAPILAFALFCAFSGISAACADPVDFKILGHWMFGINAGNVYGQRESERRDSFQAVQRLRTQLEFMSRKNLGGAIQIEIGKTNWGQASSGGALGADSGKQIKLRYAWLEWMPPKTDIRVRMGLQNYNMPSFVNGSPIFSEDGAGITFSSPIAEGLDFSAFWVRASAANEDAARPQGDRLPGFDTMDFFGMALPLAGDGYRITPYGMFAAAGINSYGSRKRDESGEWTLSPYKSSLRTVANNFMPVGGLHVLANPELANRLDPFASAWWAGLGGEIMFLEPWRLAGEFAYGYASSGSTRVYGRDFDTKREGWYTAFKGEYALDWAVPGLIFWYSSGDDGNPWNGSERMPVGKSANRNWKVLNLAYDGAPFCPDGGAQIISANGTMIGTWGLVGQIRKITFLKNLEHLLRFGYVRGTNNPAMAKDNPFYTDSKPGGYLTWQDEAFEVDFETRFKIYENLELILDADWLRVNWDEKVWKNAASDLIKDFWRVGFTAYYKF